MARSWTLLLALAALPLLAACDHAERPPSPAPPVAAVAPEPAPEPPPTPAPRPPPWGLSAPPPPPSASPTDEHLKAVTAWLDTADPEARRTIADGLQAQLGPDGTRAALAALRARRPVKAGVHRRSITVGDARLPYLVVVPRGYRPGEPIPLHLGLHGGNPVSTAESCARQWSTPARKPFILACPHTLAGHWWTPDGDATARAVLDAVTAEFDIDTDRITLGGMSNGGTGTWHLAIKYPWLWAAAVPRCAAHIPNDAYNANMARLPILLIHGDADPQIEIDSSRAMVQSLARAGNDARLIEVPDGRHSFFAELNPTVITFLGAASRALPDRFSYTPIPGALVERIYWVAAPMTTALTASITVHPDRVTVELVADTWPDHLTVYLPDSLVPDDLPVELKRPGRPDLHAWPARSAATVLQSWAETHDLRRTWARAIDLDLPP